MNQVAKEFNCIFIFDSSNRTINAYDLLTTCNNANCNYRDNDYEFYDNQNKTLPIGMDLSTKILIDSTKITYQNPKPIKTFKVVTYDEEKNELSKIKVKTINVYEGEV